MIEASRRDILATLGSAVWGSLAGCGRLSAGQLAGRPGRPPQATGLPHFAALRAIRLGGPIFKKSHDPRELAREHRRLGYSAAYCPMAKASDTDRVREIEKGFAAENVVIAEV